LEASLVFFALLAQTNGPGADEAIGWAERMNKGGVPVISLVVAIVAVAGLVLMFKKLLSKGDSFTELERGYRASIEEKAKQDRIDAENRLKDAKLDSDKRADREMAMMKERLAAEKESDATLAQAVHVIERVISVMDKVEHKLDAVDNLSRKLDDLIDRLRRQDERRL
jgi:hypothetical protein